VAKLSAVGIGVLAIAVALAGGAGFNISVLVGMAFCYASSVNFPALLLALWWRRFNTMGAVVGMLSGLIASTTLIVLSAPVWPGADSDTGSPLGDYGLDNPAIFCIPIGFLGCYLGTVLSKEKGNDREYHELYVRSETGLGAEGSESAEPVRGEPRRTEPEPEPVG
jgi:cation/acetate symporter